MLGDVFIVDLICVLGIILLVSKKIVGIIFGIDLIYGETRYDHSVSQKTGVQK